MSYNLEIKETCIKFSIFSILIYLFAVITPSASPDAAETLPPNLLIGTNEFKPRVLKAGQTIELAIPIENIGIGDAIGVILKLSSKGDLQNLQGLSFPASTDVPNIPKEGGKTNVLIKISGSYKLPDAKGKIEVSLSVPALDKTFHGAPISLETRKLVTAKLSLEDFKAEPVRKGSKSSNNRIHIQETIDLTFHVNNESKVSAENVEVKVENDQPGVKWLTLEPNTESKTEISISKLGPDQSKEVTFRCHTNDDFKDDELRLTIKALFKSKADKEHSFKITEKVRIERGPPGRLIWPFIGTICTILTIGIFLKFLKKTRTEWMVIQDKVLSDHLHKELRLGPVATMRKVLGQASIPADRLKELNELDIPSGVRDLAGLEKSVKLKSLDCENRRIGDITPLAEIKQLEKLSLSDNEISDITPLAELKQLDELYLHDNEISDITLLAELKQLGALGLNDNEISDITPLAELKQLRWLSLSDNEISDITPLAELKQLRLWWLSLSDNEISDITPLAELKQLETLYLSDNEINDFTPLSELKQLKRLYLNHNEINDITPLKELKQLKKLYLYDNEINDITILSELKQLESLSLSDNKINDIIPLSELKQLEELYLSDNEINDITPLSELKQLKQLYLKNNKINDISVLEKIERFESLQISGNPIDEEAIRRLRAQFPKLKVDY